MFVPPQRFECLKGSGWRLWCWVWGVGGMMQWCCTHQACVSLLVWLQVQHRSATLYVGLGPTVAGDVPVALAQF